MAEAPGGSSWSVVDDSLTEQERLLRFLYNCPVGIAEVGADGSIRLLNALGARLLMEAAASADLSNLFDVFDALAPAIRGRAAQFTAPAGAVFEDLRVALPRRAGGVTHLAVSLIKLDRDEYMAAFRDLSAVVAAEEQLRAAIERDGIQRGKIEIIGTILHDIGNAVTAMGTRVGRLVTDGVWPEQQSLARLRGLFETKEDALALAFPGRARAVVDMMRAMEKSLDARHQDWTSSITLFATTVTHIRQIIMLQRSVVRGSSGERERVDLRRVLEDALVVLLNAFENRNVRVVRRVDATTPRVAGDSTRLMQLLLNVLKNACESFDGVTDDRARQVSVSLDHAGGQITLVVRDNGAGFDAAAQPNFDRGTSTKPGGSGIGLASARDVARAHGGTVALTSDGVGLGAVATLRIPVNLGEGPDTE